MSYNAGMLEIVLAVLLLLPTPPGVSKAERTAWMRRVAPRLVQAAHGDRQVIAYLVSLGRYESNFARRIQAGHCRKGGECDGGLAHGIWQMHRDALAPLHYSPGDIVGTDDVHLQAAANAAARRIRQVRRMCGKRPAAVFGGYMQSCDRTPPRLPARIRLYRRVLRKLE